MRSEELTAVGCRCGTRRTTPSGWVWRPTSWRRRTWRWWTSRPRDSSAAPAPAASAPPWRCSATCWTTRGRRWPWRRRNARKRAARTRKGRGRAGGGRWGRPRVTCWRPRLNRSVGDRGGGWGGGGGRRRKGVVGGVGVTCHACLNAGGSAREGGLGAERLTGLSFEHFLCEGGGEKEVGGGVLPCLLRCWGGGGGRWGLPCLLRCRWVWG